MARIAMLLILLGILFFILYESDETKARKLLNQAVVMWDKGSYQEGYARYEEIQSLYPTTQVATESINMFYERFENYKRGFNLRMNFALNTGIVSSEVLRHTLRYYKQHQQYPKTMHELAQSTALKHSDYLRYCRYEVAVANLGMDLDCSEADIVYAKDNQQEIKQAKRWNLDDMTSNTTIEELFSLPIASQIDEKSAPVQESKSDWTALKRVASLLPSDPVELFPTGKALNTFKPINDGWGKRFDARNRLPKTGFRALYFNVNDPHTILHDTHSENIALEFAYDNGFGIEPQRFAAYWAGNLTITKPSVKTFTTNLSQASMRLLINGREVLKTNHHGKVDVALENGIYLVEVEFINNWHTTDFNLFISDPEIKRSANSLMQSISRIDASAQIDLTPSYDEVVDLNTTQLMYVGVFKSSNINEVTLDIAPTASPIHLFLNSFKAIDWVISNPHNVEIKSITYSANNAGSTVSGMLLENVPLFAYSGYYNFFADVWTCHCFNGVNTCAHHDKADLSYLEEDLNKIYMRPVSGYSLSNSTDYIRVPDTINDQHNKYRIAQHKQQNARLAKACHSNKTPSFDNVFDK